MREILRGVLIIIAIFALMTFFTILCINRAYAIDYSKLPPRSQEYIPILIEEHEMWWPEMPHISILAAQVDTETCASPTHSKCWNPNARLKTSREEGYGLGQITRAWDSQGKLRFDALEELRQKHDYALSEWTWKNVADARFQLRGVVLKNRDNYMAVNFAQKRLDRYAFMDAAYNGGLGGVLSEKRICQQNSGCNPGLWFGNVEHTSNKARKAADGYGRGFFQINRQHVEETVPGIGDGYPKSRRIKYQQAGMP